MSADSATATLAPAPARELGSTDKAYILALLLLVYISNYADRILLGILLPTIKAEFHLSDLQLGFLHGTAFAIFYATLGIPIAIYADRGCGTCPCARWSARTTECGPSPWRRGCPCRRWRT